MGSDPPWRAACKASPNFVYAVYVIFNNAYALFEAKVPRPELYPVKKIIGFDEKMGAAVEKWRAKQRPLPTFSEAIRRLVELGLKAKSGR